MKDLALNLVIGLMDRITSPLGRVRSMLTSLRSPLASLRAGASAAAGAFKQMGIAGTLVAGLTLAGPIASAGAYEAKLTDIAITAGYAGNQARSMVAELNGSYSQLALKVGQTGQEVAKGAQILIAGGVELPIVNQLLPAIGKAATAAGASMEDISKTALALKQNLNLDPKDFEKVFAELATAGKLGRFELKDMAAEFPSLAASAASIGLKGAEGARTMAAALQIAIKGAGSPAEAANNLKNFMEKIGAKETRENFKKVGIDITSVLDDAAAKGLNPFEAVVQKIRGMMGEAGGDAAKVARLTNVFADMQVLSFLKPMLQDVQGYKDIKQQMAGAQVEILDQDADTRMATIEGRMTRIKEIGTQITDRIGRGFAPLLDYSISGLEVFQSLLASIDETVPGLTDGFISVAGPLLAIVAGAGALGAILPPLAAGFSALGIIAGVALGPMLPILLAIGGAAYLVWENWDGLRGRFAVLWDGIVAIFRSAVDVFRALINGDGLALREAFGRMVGDITAIGPVIASLINSIGYIIIAGLGAAWDGLKSITSNAMQAILVALGADVGTVAAEVARIGEVFDAIGTVISTAFRFAIDVVRSLLTGELTGMLQVAWTKIDGIMNMIRGGMDWVANSWLGKQLGLSSAAAPSQSAPAVQPAPVAGAQVGGTLTVKVEGPGQVTNTESVNPSVPIEADRGPLFGMPL